jgi:membrane fusion protein (multidrug efflux system)
VIQLRKQLAAGRLKRAPGAESASVKIVLEDGSEYPQAGRLLFSDLSVDPTSGQVTLRAEVPNANGLLLPGMYVRVKLEQAQVGNAILLPQQAVTRSGQGDSVMVVDKEGKVAPRPVKVGNEQNGSWVILGGLNPGEQVIVEGFQKIRPGAPVKAVPWQPGGAPAARAPVTGAPAPASAAKK